MTALPKKSRGSGKRWLIRLVIAVVLAVVAWFGHGTVLEWIAWQILEKVPPSIGWHANVSRIRIHLLEPAVFEDLVLEKQLETGREKLRFRASRVSVVPAAVDRILFGPGGMVRLVELSNFDLNVDWTDRDWDFAAREPDGSQDQDELSRWIPETVVLNDGQVTLTWAERRLEVERISGRFSEQAPSSVTVGRLQVSGGDSGVEAENLTGVTAWKEGVAYVDDVRLARDTILRTLVLGLFDPAGMSMSATLEIGEGTLRIDAATRTTQRELQVDLAVFGTSVPLAPLARHLNVEMKGKLRDGRLTFRGNPERLVDSEIALRVRIEGLEREGQTWDAVVAGANYIGRKLYLSNFQMVSDDSRLAGSGEFSFLRTRGSEGLSEFAWNLQMDIRDLRKLRVFVPKGFEDIQGRLSFHGELRGRDGRLDGYGEGVASDVILRGLRPASVILSAVAKDRELQVRSAEFWSGNDKVMLKGAVSLDPPFVYGGELTMTLVDAAPYTKALGGRLAGILGSGGLELTWQGDGTNSAHSGAFRANLVDATTPWTPSGLTGQFTASYSPENLYFSELVLQQKHLTLSSCLTVSAAGVNFSDVILKRRGSFLLEGEGFFPLDLYGLLAGDSLAESLNMDRPLYARFASKRLAVDELIALVGQDAGLEGEVSLDFEASGFFSRLDLIGQVTLHGMRPDAGQPPFPTTDATLSVKTVDQALDAYGTLSAEGFDPVSLRASIPFRFEKAADGSLRWSGTDLEMQGEIEAPKTSLAMIGSLVPGIENTIGVFSGALEVTGPMNAPIIQGKGTIADAGLVFSRSPLPPLSDVNLELEISGPQVAITGTGKMGSNLFELGGVIDLSTQEFDLNASAEDFQVPWGGAIATGSCSIAVEGHWAGPTASGEAKLSSISTPVPPELEFGLATAKEPPSPDETLQTDSVGFPEVPLDISVRVSPAKAVSGGRLTLGGSHLQPELSGSIRLSGWTVKTTAGQQVELGGELFFNRTRSGQSPTALLSGAIDASPSTGQFWLAGPLMQMRVISFGGAPLRFHGDPRSLEPRWLRSGAETVSAPYLPAPSVNLPLADPIATFRTEK